MTKAEDSPAQSTATVESGVGVDQSPDRDPVKFFGLRLPQPAEQAVYKVQDFWQGVRMKLIPALPRGVVNAASNIVGVGQIIGEFLMMKSTGTTLVPDKSKWYNYILQPPVAIYETVFKKARSATPLRELLKPEKFLQNAKSFTNLEQAAKIDSLNHTIPLLNRWTARSSFSAIVGMGMNMVLPEVKELPEQVEANAMMRTNNPIRYQLQCFGEALWFPIETASRVVKKAFDPQSDQRIGEHKRQFAGLGLLGAGLCSVVSGFRQIDGNFLKGEKQIYRRNRWHILGGMITSIAGHFLMTGVNNQQGWGNFGSTQMGRMAVLYPSIKSRFTPGVTGKLEDNRWWYVAGQAVFQGKNAFASLVGGAEVRKDGTVDYHVGEKKKAITEAKRVKEERRHEKEEHRHEKVLHEIERKTATHPHPTTTVTAAAAPERAMPERVAEQGAATV